MTEDASAHALMWTMTQGAFVAYQRSMQICVSFRFVYISVENI